jgi:hypothetical protein
MIAYGKKIILRENRTGDWMLESDKGFKYLTSPIVNTRTPITDWWEKNVHNDLREWQKDAIVKTLGDSFDATIIPYLVYRKGHGYSQSHDITLVRFDTTWVLSTQKDLWITNSNYGEIIFDIEDSLGSVLDRNVRDVVYKIADAIKEKNNA